MRRAEDIRTQLREFRAILPPADMVPIPGDFAMKLQIEAWRIHEDELKRELGEAEEAEKQSERAASLLTERKSLPRDVEVQGNIRFTGELLIDGKIQGEIISEGTLIVGKNAEVQGEIRAKTLTVFGRVNGNVTVTERCELKASANFSGDLRATRLLVEDGATFIGRSETTGKMAWTAMDVPRQLAPEKKVEAVPVTA